MQKVTEIGQKEVDISNVFCVMHGNSTRKLPDGRKGTQRVKND